MLNLYIRKLIFEILVEELENNLVKEIENNLLFKKKINLF